MRSTADKKCGWCGRFVAAPCRNAEQSAVCEEPETQEQLFASRPSRRADILPLLRFIKSEESK